MNLSNIEITHIFLSIVRKVVKRRSAVCRGMRVKDRRDYLLNEKLHLRVFLSLQILIFSSFWLLFGAFFFNTVKLLPCLAASGWVLNSFSLMRPSFDVTLRMHRRTWEVLTSAYTSNNICRQDKQQNQRRNSPTTSDKLYFFPFYIISILPRSHLLGAVSYWTLHDQQRQDGSRQSMILVTEITVSAIPG